MLTCAHTVSFTWWPLAASAPRNCAAAMATAAATSNKIIRHIIVPLARETRRITVKDHTATRPVVLSPFMLLVGALNFVKHTAVREVRLLCVLPASENFIDGNQF